jgi:hypothetical protein
MKNAAKVKVSVDLVFLVDATGSMQTSIDDLRNYIVMLMGLLDELRPVVIGSQAFVIDWRARVCGYRDVPEDGEEWFVDNPFVSDSAALESQLDKLEAKGGGDEPESLLDGLWKVATCGATEKGDPPDPLKWRHRYRAVRFVMVFTDATYHEEMSIGEARGGTWEDAAKVIEQELVVVSLFAPDFPCYDTLAQIDRCEWEPIPFDPDAKDGAVKALREFTSDKANLRESFSVLQSVLFGSL